MEMRKTSWLSKLEFSALELRAALRRLTARPGHSLVVVTVLGLGIGVSCAIYSLVHASLLRPLPFPEPDRVVEIRTVAERVEREVFGASDQDARDWAERSRTIASLGTYSTGRLNLLPAGGRAVSVAIAHVTPGMFTALGVRPLLGRNFLPDEDLPGGDSDKAILSYALWQSLYGGRSDILGEDLRTVRGTLEIVGVARPGQTFPDRTELWIPAQSIYDLRGTDRADPARRSGRKFIHSVGRLASGTTLAQANAELVEIGRQLQDEYPETNAEMLPEVVPLRSGQTEALRPYLRMSSWAGLLILAICWANVAGLILVRAEGRRQELALRSVLGAGRPGLARSLFVESFLVALGGGALGIGLAFALLQAFRYLVPVDLPAWLDPRLDLPVLTFAVLITTLGALVLGLVPMARLSRHDTGNDLRQRSASASGATGPLRLRPTLVVAQVALCLVLLSAAGLLVRSLLALERVDTGLESDDVTALSLSVYVPGDNQERIRGITSIYRRLLDRIEQIPGVVAAGGTDNFPYANAQYADRVGYTVEARGETAEDRRFRAPTLLVDVTPDYFRAVGIPLLEGRNFTYDDTLDSPMVIILSERAAEELFPDRPALGQEVRIAYDGGGADKWAQVVGIVGNVKYNQRWDERGVELYYPYSQYGLTTTHLAVRSRAGGADLENQLRLAIADVAPDVAVESVTTFESMISDSLWQDRLWGFLVSTFSLLALLLASLGIYGVLADSVAQSKGEMGVRLALGAVPSDLALRITRGGLALVAVGILVAVAVTPFVLSVLRSLLFGVEANLLTSILPAATVLLVISMAACLVPALRAARVDPLDSLRQQ